MNPEPARDAIDFSLVPSGLLDRLQMRMGLMRPPTQRLLIRATIVALLAWLPLCVIALIQGDHFAGAVPFFKDITVHVRFLVVIPVLVLVEASIGLRTRWVVGEFLTSGLVTESEAPRFSDAVRRAKKLLDAGWTDVILLAAVYAFVWLVVRGTAIDASAFWYEDATSHDLSPAGWWYAWIASPIVMFLFLRWMWRYFVWSWFLRRMSRLDLRLTGTHPDRTGGLGFIRVGHTSFAAVSLAASCVVSAAAANRILNDGASLKSFQSPLIGFVVLSIVVGLAPLLTFMKPLIRTKRRGLLTYGRFGSLYVLSFERKWLGENPPPADTMLGSGDIQSLADLGGSFERLDNMRVIPFDRKAAMSLAFAAVAPMLPLLLTVMPLRDMVRLLLKAMM